MNYKLIFGAIVLIAASSLAGYLMFVNAPEEKGDQNNGHPDTEKSDDKNVLMKVHVPSPNQVIESPLIVKGEARGSWYFEATFPVVLVNWDGVIIAESHAQAEGKWMTEEFVPFEATLEFETPIYGENGTLMLQRSNPSGLLEHEEAFEVSVKFKRELVGDLSREKGGCVITGCSSQVCAEADVITTCEYLPEYACYETAVCERQQNGECGWTMMPELESCLSGSK